MNAVPPLVVRVPAAPQPDPAATVATVALARTVDLVVIHCSATPSGKWIGGAPASAGYVNAARLIDGWHKARGFQRSDAARARLNPELGSIGYHYVIDLDGAVYSGRHPDEVGAHVAGFNARSLGICMVGGAERDARYTVGQWRALGRLVRETCLKVGLVPRAPLYPRNGGGVCGHRDLSPDANADGVVTPTEWLKTCPGFDVAAWLQRGMEPTGAQICEAVR